MNRFLDELTAEAIKSGFNHELIGKQLFELSEGPNAIELAVAYAAVIAKARRARKKANERRESELDNSRVSE